MKIYISADIEGVTGIGHWNETTKGNPDYQPFKEQMTKEVKAACEGANDAGAKEILIKDAHDSARNIEVGFLPTNISLIRSFNGHPFCMMYGLDSSFDAAVMIGYHSAANMDNNPLAHTLNPEMVHIKINGEYASEFLINAYTASLVGVPVVFVSGDVGLMEKVNELNPHIKTVGVNKGEGSSVISIHPDIACQNIREKVKQALSSDMTKCKIERPEKFIVELSYFNHTKAYRASFYPGMKKMSTRTLLFETDDYFEVLRMLSFTV